MSRPSTYVFCRYVMSDSDGPLDGAAQYQTIAENHGRLMDYASRGRRTPARALFMEPLESKAGARRVIGFFMGLQPGVRQKVGYDRRRARRTMDIEGDTHIKAAHIVMVPSIGCMAVEDRAGDNNIPASTALAAFRSLVRAIHEEGELEFNHVSDAEVRSAIETWEITQFDYTLRPLNPISLGDFANLRSEAMKQDLAAREVARLTPAEGGVMQANGGIISQTQEVADAGYAQTGFRGYTPEGHEAHVPKPRFHMDKRKNLEERERTRILRVRFDQENSRDETEAEIARTL